MTPLLASALAWAAAGFSVVPVSPDGSKSPAGSEWKTRQAERAGEEEVRAWFGGSAFDGFGLVCGEVSLRMEMLELEGRAVRAGMVAAITTAMAEHGLAELWDRLNHGYLEATPGAGLHWIFRVLGGARRNLKLARRPATAEELAAKPGEKLVVLAETRGEGGFVVVAPSAGRSHPSGKPWVTLVGGPASVPVITAAERDALYAVVSLFDATPVPTPEPLPLGVPGGTQALGGLRPGDDYNARASWADLLGPRGWDPVRRMGDGYAWRRPDKADPGISATTGQSRDGVDRLYVFSTSTEFEAERPYTKFGAYALLEHGGDYSAAAKALRAAGYGAAPPETPRHLSLAHSAAPTEGTAALKLDTPGSAIPTAVVDATLTDTGNAELFIARHGQRFRYVASRGAWIRWDGTRWEWCESDAEAITAAVDTIRAIRPADKEEAKHQIRSLSRRGLEAAVSLAARDPRIATPADALDAHPFALCTPAGVVDLRDGGLRPAEPGDLHTKVTGVGYDPAATAPRWMRFLADTFGGDAEIVAYLQRLAGYAAVGLVTHHILPFLYGSGGNGKSVFLDVMLAVLGDYASTAPSGFLMAGGREDDNAIARLAGLRVVVCSEVNAHDKFDEAKVKLLTGGDRLTARFLYQRHFTFSPSHTLWLMGNHQPTVGAGGEAFWRRLRLLPFTRVVPEADRVEGLAEQLFAEEAAGILAWVVAGAGAAIRGGLDTPASVMAATATYAEEEDAFARFLEERCILGGGDKVKTNTSAVRAAYDEWCRAEGIKVLSKQHFGRELRDRFGVASVKSNGVRFYLGLTLLRDPEADDTPSWADR